MTRYVFIGAGAVGSGLGGLLAQRGSDVLLVARGEHARAMIEHGLTVRCADATVARAILGDVWAKLGQDGDPLRVVTLAHFMADLQDDPADELEWITVPWLPPTA